MELDYSKFKEFIEFYAIPRWKNQNEKWPLRPGGGELYIQEKVLKKAAPYFTKDALQKDIIASLLNGLKFHFNLLSRFEFSHAKKLIETSGKGELEKQIFTLFYNSDSLESRIQSFLEWAKIEPIAESGKKRGINATVCSYFLALSNPRIYPYCKPTAYQGAIECLFLTDEKKSDPAKRIVHCQYIYQKALDLLEKEYGLKNGNLFDVHSLFYLYKEEAQPSEGDKQYWIYAPGQQARLWDELYEKGLMAIGWDKLGDLRNYKTKYEIQKRMQDIFNYDTTPKSRALICFAFANEIQPGDMVFVKRGKKELIGYGIVGSDYIYDPSRNEYCHTRMVSWQMKGSWKLSEAQSRLSGYTLPIKTLSNITRFRSLVKDICEFLGIEQIASYLPTKNDFAIAYGMVADLGQEISLDIVLDKLGENAKKQGYILEENWRRITENNVINNWQEK